MLIGTLSHIPYAQFSKMMLLPAALSPSCVLAVLLVVFRGDPAEKKIFFSDQPEPPLDRRLALLCVLVLAFVITGFLRGQSLSRSWPIRTSDGSPCPWSRRWPQT